MDDSTLYARMHAGLREFCRLVGRASPQARAVELEGVTASVTAVTPDRSITNSVVYDTTDHLSAALPELEALYEEAGVRAWTVWVPAHDARSAQLLSEAGHKLDAAPAAMCMSLDDLAVAAPDDHDLDLDPEPQAQTLAHLNDRAYSFDTPDFTNALQSLPDLVIHVARVGGSPASCVGTYDHEGDAYIGFVATLPEARGRGLAGKLMALALHEARARGCTTTSLQATKMGYPVYLRIGYRDLGPLQMWERRAAP